MSLSRELVDALVQIIAGEKAAFPRSQRFMELAKEYGVELVLSAADDQLYISKPLPAEVTDEDLRMLITELRMLR